MSLCHQHEEVKTTNLVSQVSSQRKVVWRQERKDHGSESTASLMPIVKKEFTAFPERLSKELAWTEDIMKKMQSFFQAVTCAILIEISHSFSELFVK